MVGTLMLNRKEQEAHMEIDGHKITICFADEFNPALATLVKETLIDAFLRKNGIGQCDLITE